MRYFTLTFILLQLFACNEKPSNWENPEFSELDFEPNTLTIENFSIDGTPLKTSVSQLTAKLGEPEEIIEQRNIRISPTDSVNFQTLHFRNRNLVFNNFQDSVTIEFINFKDSNIEIMAGEHVLSSNTKFREIKKMFPDSYAWRNPGLSLIASMLDDEATSEISEFNHIHISDGELVNGQYGFIELSFMNGQLAYLIYSHEFKKTST